MFGSLPIMHNYIYEKTVSSFYYMSFSVDSSSLSHIHLADSSEMVLSIKASVLPTQLKITTMDPKRTVLIITDAHINIPANGKNRIDEYGEIRLT